MWKVLKREGVNKERRGWKNKDKSEKLGKEGHDPGDRKTVGCVRRRRKAVEEKAQYINTHTE